MKNYSQAQEYLETLIPTASGRKYPGELGLRRMKHFLKLLGNPQKKFNTVHVTGTSGKGSTGYLISKMLEEAGFKVGLHLSPHLVYITERMQINNQLLNEKKFVELVDLVRPVVSTMGDSRFGSPSYFEVLVGISFLAFAKAKVDVAVVEVGVGGRFDGTNVLQPLVAVLTNVGLDHTNILGSSVEKIAKDKMRIIKPGCVVVTGVKQNRVLKILKKHCEEVGSELVGVIEDSGKRLADKVDGEFRYKIVSVSDKGSVFSIKTVDGGYYDLKLALLGRHQVENASLAIATVGALKRYGVHVSKKVVRRTLGKASFPGRLEVVGKRPLVVIDGAHNPDKMRALVLSFTELFKYKKLIVVFAVKRDKDALSMLKSLVRKADKIVMTAFLRGTDVGFGLSEKPKKLEKMVREKLKYENMDVVEDSNKAVKLALEEADREDAVLITGSLYLIGEVREFLMRRLLKRK